MQERDLALVGPAGGGRSGRRARRRSSMSASTSGSFVSTPIVSRSSYQNIETPSKVGSGCPRRPRAASGAGRSRGAPSCSRTAARGSHPSSRMEVLERAVRRAPQGRGEDLIMRLLHVELHPGEPYCRTVPVVEGHATGCRRIGSSRCWSPAPSTTRSSCSIRRPRRDLERRRAAPSRATRRTRSSAGTSRRSIRPRTSRTACPRELEVARPTGATRRRVARPQGRHPLLGERRDHRAARRAGHARRASARSAAT